MTRRTTTPATRTTTPSTPATDTVGSVKPTADAGTSFGPTGSVQIPAQAVAAITDNAGISPTEPDPDPDPTPAQAARTALADVEARAAKGGSKKSNLPSNADAAKVLRCYESEVADVTAADEGTVVTTTDGQRYLLTPDNIVWLRVDPQTTV